MVALVRVVEAAVASVVQRLGYVGRKPEQLQAVFGIISGRVVFASEARRCKNVLCLHS